MTGPVPAGGEELREAIGSGLCRLPRVWTGDFGPYDLTDAVLPTVLAAMDAEGRRRAAEELLAAAKWALLEAASHEGYAAKGMARNSDLRAAEARVFRAASNRLTARAAALAPENARPE